MSALLDKVLVLHQLGLPYDVVNYINSFRFYDQHQLQLRHNKLAVNRKIQRAFNGHHVAGQWWFCAGFYTIDNDEDETFEVQFQASNCKRCGNYMNGNNFYTASSRCICTCFLDQNIYPTISITDNDIDTEVDGVPLIMHM